MCSDLYCDCTMKHKTHIGPGWTVSSLAVTSGFAVGPADPGAAPGATEGHVLKGSSEQLVKPPVTDGECKVHSGSVKKKLAIRAQLLTGSQRHWPEPWVRDTVCAYGAGTHRGIDQDTHIDTGLYESTIVCCAPIVHLKCNICNFYVEPVCFNYNCVHLQYRFNSILFV